PQFDHDVSETLEADSVILAVGQQADLSFLKPEDGVELTPQGTIKVDRDTLATTAPGLFAGGDVAFGPRNLISRGSAAAPPQMSLAAAKEEEARAILAYLRA